MSTQQKRQTNGSHEKGYIMAIQVYCVKCRSSFELTTKQCPKCGVLLDRGNRKYRVAVTVQGARKIKIVDNLTIAREIESTVKADVLRGEFDIATNKAKKCITLGELWERHYLLWARENKKSWIDDKRYYERHLKDRFAGKRLDQITALDLERLKNELRKGVNRRGKPFAAQTIKHVLIIVRRLYNVATKWNLYTGANPIAGVQLPKIDNEQTEYLTDEQLQALLTTLDQWPFREPALFIKFALFSGCRRGELFKLTWNDVDFERQLITLTDPKGGRTETLPLSDEAMNVLREVEVTDSPFVFPGRNGEQRTDIKHPWARICRAAGLPLIRFHGLRHNFASRLVSSGVSLEVVQKLLCHKSPTVTARYAHLQPDVVKRAAIESGKLLKPAKQNLRIIRKRETL